MEISEQNFYGSLVVISGSHRYLYTNTLSFYNVSVNHLNVVLLLFY